MDYDSLKDQWNEIEERDGVRLSWNTFPSSRMVCNVPVLNLKHALIEPLGSIEASWYAH